MVGVAARARRRGRLPRLAGVHARPARVGADASLDREDGWVGALGHQRAARQGSESSVRSFLRPLCVESSVLGSSRFHSRWSRLGEEPKGPQIQRIDRSGHRLSSWLFGHDDRVTEFAQHPFVLLGLLDILFVLVALLVTCWLSPRERFVGDEQKVWDEWERFNAALPDLLTKYSERWVVFRDGSVHGDFADEDAAYVAAVAKFGVRGCFIICQVTTKPSVILHGRVSP